jgi:hypothetical protein
MKIFIHIKIFYILFAISILIACSEEESDPPAPVVPDPVDERVYTPEISLKDAAGYPIGLATQSHYPLNSDYEEIAGKEFNSFTAEWEMKQNVTNPEEGVYAWVQSDAVVSFAKSFAGKILHIKSIALPDDHGVRVTADFCQDTGKPVFFGIHQSLHHS